MCFNAVLGAKSVFHTLTFMCLIHVYVKLKHLKYIAVQVVKPNMV